MRLKEGVAMSGKSGAYVRPQILCNMGLSLEAKGLLMFMVAYRGWEKCEDEYKMLDWLCQESPTKDRKQIADCLLELSHFGYIKGDDERSSRDNELLEC